MTCQFLAGKRKCRFFELDFMHFARKGRVFGILNSGGNLCKLGRPRVRTESRKKESTMDNVTQKWSTGVNRFVLLRDFMGLPCLSVFSTRAFRDGEAKWSHKESFSYMDSVQQQEKETLVSFGGKK